MMVVVAAAVVGGRRRRRKRGRTSGGTRVHRRGDWEGGEKVMVNRYIVLCKNGRWSLLSKAGGRGDKKGGQKEERKGGKNVWRKLEDR